MKNFYIILVIAAMAWSCQPATESTDTATDTVVEDSTAMTTNTFGVVVDEASAMTLASLQEAVMGKDSAENLTVTGKVVEVCQMKGCWMTIEKPDGSTMRVTFKDYALEMPKDLSGKEVVMHGKAMVKTSSVEDLKHLAKDGGKTAEEIATITAPETALAFEADGVLIK